MTTVQHLALNCRDRLASEQFYTRYFGCKRARVFNEGLPDEFVMLRLGAMCLELFGAKDSSDARGGEQAVGFKHLAFEVPDIDATIAKLQAAGIETGGLIDVGRHVPGMRICFFKDPDGNILELMQGWSDQEL